MCVFALCHKIGWYGVGSFFVFRFLLDGRHKDVSVTRAHLKAFARWMPTHRCYVIVCVYSQKPSASFPSLVKARAYSHTHTHTRTISTGWHININARRVDGGEGEKGESVTHVARRASMRKYAVTYFYE